MGESSPKNKKGTVDECVKSLLCKSPIYVLVIINIKKISLDKYKFY